MSEDTPYIPKPDLEGVNAEIEGTPLKDLAVLLSGFALILLVFYFSLGVLSDWALSRISIQTEVKIFNPIWGKAYDNSKSPTGLATFVNQAREHVGFPFKVDLICEESVNAFALPGGQILFTSGLLKNIKTENGLMFVLGHELGHVANRDHIKGLGRQIILASSGAIIGLNDLSQLSSLSFLVTKTYNRGQEHSADEYGLDLLQKIYGHTQGAEELFVALSKKKSFFENKITNLGSTHPTTDERIQRIKSTQNESAGEVILPKTPFSEWVKVQGCA